MKEDLTWCNEQHPYSKHCWVLFSTTPNIGWEHPTEDNLVKAVGAQRWAWEGHVMRAQCPNSSDRTWSGRDFRLNFGFQVIIWTISLDIVFLSRGFLKSLLRDNELSEVLPKKAPMIQLVWTAILNSYALTSSRAKSKDSALLEELSQGAPIENEEPSPFQAGNWFFSLVKSPWSVSATYAEVS